MTKAATEHANRTKYGGLTLNTVPGGVEQTSPSKAAIETAQSIRGLTARAIVNVGTYVKVKWFRNNKPYQTFKQKVYSAAAFQNFINDFADWDALPSDGATAGLVSNGDFETNVTGWTGVTSTVTRDTTQYQLGSASMKITPSTNTVNATTPLTLVVSSSYTARAFVKGTKGNSVYFVISGGNGTSPVTVLTGDWQVVSFTWTATTTGPNLEIHSDTNTTPVYVDAVRVRLT